MEEWKPLQDDEELKTGDVIRVWSQVVGMGKVPTALELEHVAKKVEASDPRYRVEGWSLPDADKRFFVKVRIVEPREPAMQLAGPVVAGALVGAVLAVVGIALGILALGYGERRSVTTAVGETADRAAWGIAKWAAVAIVGYLAVKSVKGAT